MRYARDLNNLKAFIEIALSDKGLTARAGEAGLDLDYVRAELEKRADDIWSYAGEAIQKYTDADARYVAALAEVARYVKPAPPWLGVAGEVRNVAAAAITLAVILFLGYGFNNGFVEAAELLRHPVIFPLLLMLAAVAVIGNLFPARLKSRHAAARRRAEQHFGLDALREERARLDGEAMRSVVAGITEECNELFDQQLEPSYSTEWGVKSSSGLAEVMNTSYAVNTEAREKLNAMLNSMPGGSVGIAGPRGAGKTTLIWAYCGGAVDKLGERQRPVLGVMTSAPVEYEPRDFILYLFLSVCQAVLTRFKEDLNDPPWQSAAYGPRVNSPRARYNIKFLAAALLYTGAAVIALALALAALPPAPKPAANANAGPAQAAATPSPAPTPNPFVRYVQAFDPKPGALLAWGVFVALPGAFLLAYLASARRRARRPEPFMPPGMEGKPRPAYVRAAWDWVKAIKFQQSFTSGWSGALKLPVGLEGNLTRAETLAENQKSLPEIVGGLRDFLQSVTNDFDLIIGIDELDKIESDEKAQQFVNEIKSVFGLRHCFYLVSVSESAMSSFERRGIPFRDAFDSSFDNILHVDYLTFDAAKRLIARRVVGMSTPFRCLCYCASGGLARDLIRACRNLIDLSRAKAGPPGDGDFDALSLALARQDIKAKIRAVMTSAQKIELEPEAADFLAGLIGLERAVDAGEPPLPGCAKIRVSLSRELSADKQEAKMLAERRLKLAALGEELTTYVYYWQTVLDFLGAELRAGTLGDEGRDAMLHVLARARQSLSIKPAIARSVIEDFRRGRGLPLHDFSAGASPAAPPRAPANGSHAALLFVADPRSLGESIEGLKGLLEKMSAGGNGG